MSSSLPEPLLERGAGFFLAGAFFLTAARWVAFVVFFTAFLPVDFFNVFVFFTVFLATFLTDFFTGFLEVAAFLVDFVPATVFLAVFFAVCFLAFFLEVAAISEFLFVTEKISAPFYYIMLRERNNIVYIFDDMHFALVAVKIHPQPPTQPQETVMPIATGDKIPSVTLKQMMAKGPRDVRTDELFSGRKVVLFALPGAFTPTCSAYHLPGYIEKSGDLLAKGVDTIICLSVNDAFVMGAWGREHNAQDRVMMIADGNAEFTRAVGLDVDLSAGGMGVRSQRYAMVVEDGVVTRINVDAPRKFEVSDAQTILNSL